MFIFVFRPNKWHPNYYDFRWEEIPTFCVFQENERHVHSSKKAIGFNYHDGSISFGLKAILAWFLASLLLSMTTSSSGFYFCLALLIIRCTRGEKGVVFVIKYMSCHWETFTLRFEAFCKALVTAAEKICQQPVNEP